MGFVSSSVPCPQSSKSREPTSVGTCTSHQRSTVVRARTVRSISMARNKHWGLGHTSTICAEARLAPLSLSRCAQLRSSFKVGIASSATSVLERSLNLFFRTQIARFVVLFCETPTFVALYGMIRRSWLCSGLTRPQALPHIVHLDVVIR